MSDERPFDYPGSSQGDVPTTSAYWDSWDRHMEHRRTQREREIALRDNAISEDERGQ